MTSEGSNGRLGQLHARLLDSAGLDDIPAPEPLIDGLLFRDSLAWLHGKPGHAKSLVALDWACCIDAGLPWMGLPVAQGTVLYVIAEGAGGMRPRVRAWEDRAGRKTGVMFLPVAVQMLNLADSDALAELGRNLGAVLIVLDTQARLTVGVEENSAAEMGKLVARAEAIRQASQACVLFVHHEARAGESMRGSTVLEGAATSILRVVKDGSRVELTCPKQKDVDPPGPMTLWVTPRLDSVVLAGQGASPTLDSLTGSEITVMRVLLDSFGTIGASGTTLLGATGLPRSSFYYALNRLVKARRIVNQGTQRRSLYVLAPVPLGGESNQSKSNESKSNAHLYGDGRWTTGPVGPAGGTP